MPDLRPMVDHSQVFTLLSQHFIDPITALTPIEGGQVARTFAFRAGKQEYIVRFHKDNMLTSNFPKEAYVHQKLVATRIPLPPLVQVGRFGDLHFAILQKMPGKMLEQHTPQEVEQHREVPFYAERLLCYQCYLALDGLRFFAASANEQAYQMTRGIIVQKLDAFAR